MTEEVYKPFERTLIVLWLFLNDLFTDCFFIDPNSAVEDIANTMERTSSSIRLLIPNFYSYSYDGSGDRYISDGGSDMYDTGNKVNLCANVCKMINSCSYRSC